MNPEEEIQHLRNQTNTIINRLDSLEEKITGEKPSPASVKEENKVSVGGIILLAFGILLSFTSFLIIIGVPIAIVGIVLIIVKATSGSSQTVHQEIVKEAAAKPGSKRVVSHAPVKKEVKPKKSLEERIGAGWLGIIGIAALVIGIAFFIFMENNGLGHMAKVLIGTLFGVAVIFFGDWFSKKKNYEVWGQILTGGGFAITYFSVYSAHFIYEQATRVSQVMSTLFLVVVALAAILYSAIKNSKIVAVESFVLGYAAAFLAPVEGIMVLLYGLILSIAAMVVQAKKHWIPLSYFAMPATYLLYLFWHFQNGNLWIGLSFLITYFLVFNLNIWNSIKEETGIVVSNILNGIIFFFAMWALMETNNHENMVGWIALAIAGFYGLLYLVMNRKESFSNIYPGIFFLALFVVLKINDELVTVILVLMMLLFGFVASKYKMKHLTYSTRALGIFIVIKTVFFDLGQLHSFDAINFFNSTALLSSIVSIVGFYIMTLFDKDEFGNVFRYSASGMVIIVGIQQLHHYTALVTLLFAIMSLIFIVLKSKESRIQGIIFYVAAAAKTLLFDTWRTRTVERASSFYNATITSLIPTIIMSYVLRYRTGMQIFSWIGTFFAALLVLIEFSGFSVSGLWALLGLLLLLAGFKANTKELRLQGIILFGITIVKVFAYDTMGLEPVFRTLSFIALGVILIFASFLYAKNKEKVKEII